MARDAKWDGDRLIRSFCLCTQHHRQSNSGNDSGSGCERNHLCAHTDSRYIVICSTQHIRSYSHTHTRILALPHRRKHGQRAPYIHVPTEFFSYERPQAANSEWDGKWTLERLWSTAWNGSRETSTSTICCREIGKINDESNGKNKKQKRKWFFVLLRFLLRFTETRRGCKQMWCSSFTSLNFVSINSFLSSYLRSRDRMIRSTHTHTLTRDRFELAERMVNAIEANCVLEMPPISVVSCVRWSNQSIHSVATSLIRRSDRKRIERNENDMLSIQTNAGIQCIWHP